MSCQRWTEHLYSGTEADIHQTLPTVWPADLRCHQDDEIVGWTHEGHRREELMLLGVELVEQEVSSGPVSVELTRKLLEVRTGLI